MYFLNTAVCFEGKELFQKKGVCIGSQLAPLLSEVYLSGLDLKVETVLTSMSGGSALVKRCIDDILVCTTKGSDLAMLLDFIRSATPELAFATKFPKNGLLQFPDVKISLANGLCWRYGRDEPKPLLPYMSCHAKTVKRGAAASLLNSALRKSCMHKVAEAMQVSEFLAAGYKRELVVA